MPLTRWPYLPPSVDFEDSPGVGWNDWYFIIVPDTCCKHGHDECERCGTTNRRDAKHTTVGGKGLVARIERGK